MTDSAADYHARIQQGIDKVKRGLVQYSAKNPQAAREMGQIVQGITDCVGALERRVMALEREVRNKGTGE